MNDETMSGLADLFVALSDKTRLRLLGLIGGREVSVGYLADALGESQPKVSRHLAYLRGAGLVSTRRDGKWIYYCIDMPEDPSHRHVLLETLRTLGAELEQGQRNYQLPDHRSDIHVPFETEYRPQEIEIYLL